MPPWSFLLNTGAALLMGMAIGLERQWWHHPAGLRTNTLVALGAATVVPGPATCGQGEQRGAGDDRQRLGACSHLPLLFDGSSAP